MSETMTAFIVPGWPVTCIVNRQLAGRLAGIEVYQGSRGIVQTRGRGGGAPLWLNHGSFARRGVEPPASIRRRGNNSAA